MTFHRSLPNFGMKCRAWRRYCWSFRTDQLSRERTDTALSRQSRLPSTPTFPLRPSIRNLQIGKSLAPSLASDGSLPWWDRQVAGSKPQESHSSDEWGAERCNPCIAQAQAEKTGLANWPYCWIFKKSECSKRNHFKAKSDCWNWHNTANRWCS